MVWRGPFKPELYGYSYLCNIKVSLNIIGYIKLIYGEFDMKEPIRTLICAKLRNTTIQRNKKKITKNLL